MPYSQKPPAGRRSQIQLALELSWKRVVKKFNEKTPFPLGEFKVELIEFVELVKKLQEHGNRIIIPLPRNDAL